MSGERIQERIQVGVVDQIFRYPVKSMRGESLETSGVGWHGLLGDRRYAFVRQGTTSDFPWLTASRMFNLLRYQPALTDPANPEGSSIRVRTPEGQEFEIHSGVQTLKQVRADG